MVFAKNYNNFINSCYVEEQGYRLTGCSDLSPYAACFAIFGKHLLNKDDELFNRLDFFDELLRNNIDLMRDKRVGNGQDIRIDKPYLQLLTFTLSALSILGTLKNSPLSEHVEPLFDDDIINRLTLSGTFFGKPGTGNLAMFYAILLIHRRDYLNKDIGNNLSRWVDEHLLFMNKFGFWGEKQVSPYLQFQNGYHQYEIFDYLGVQVPFQSKMMDSVAALADKEGHFSPYPGGGGCYDYDAIFLLTLGVTAGREDYTELLQKTVSTIVVEQNIDGGFCESKYIRPTNLDNLAKMLSHVCFAPSVARKERLRYCLTLLRPKYNRIETHWSYYSRKWFESNLWDSWFRMLLIARVDKYINKDDAYDWGFIDYPGIGFNASK